ncbi:hypothetical protein BDD43_3349 [Mucilaginibacter gracilis]|uniref:Uncharacterized protein n=1 Tax=Mucilaginibacter gracilis TaxID=423350 RepID=A0A495J2I2_9SPHI|nr:hypothetical protein BDD43_3349 [Mucilaginibacter gracilis]
MEDVSGKMEDVKIGVIEKIQLKTMSLRAIAWQSHV